MDVRIISSISDFEGLRDAWRELETADPTLPHQLTYEYVAAWLRTTPADHELLVTVAEDHGELVGVLPLAIMPRSAGPIRWRELGFPMEGDHRDVIVDARRLKPSTITKALLGHAFEAARGVQRINLRYLPSESHLLLHLLRTHEHNAAVRPLVEIPRIEMHRFTGFAEYRRTVPRSALTSLNKQRRELGIEVTEISPISSELFAEFVALHLREKEHLVEHHGRRERRSLFEDPRRLATYRDVVVDKSHATAFVARTGEGRLAFYELAWRRDRRVWAWNTAYEPDFAQWRPSRARISAIEGLFAAGDTDVYDLGAGRYPWKFELTSHFAQSYQWTSWQGKDPVTRLLRRVRP
ncbi:GNAT family N-acetyltransferase [Propioniciclava sp. MC1683]|uniref:GNAT family N-acetyltransferase n=1 Tax=Propioniciclava sp. MC1683 TaxID=2760309 RepID=UPI0015FF0C0B|nr:GNAT family N-acetyltransferase [Propioniciclava sp. MC1683]MBB1501347.1 GNAT family N-acetyltransferase [Propioniciclava sp. MC1683]